MMHALSDLSLAPGSVQQAALALAGLGLLVALAFGGPPALGAEHEAAAGVARDTLVERHGEGEAARIDRGIGQVLRFWREEDGSAEELRAFLETEFLPRGEALDATFGRLEFTMERVGGYMTSLVRDLRRGADLEIGPMLPIDQRLAAYSPGAHLADDFFANKLAFVVLLNFPLTSLEQRLADGGGWSRREWAETRLAHGFDSRVPAEVGQAISQAYADADSYISSYNILMHHLVDDDGRRLFPAGKRLISHWGLRDELKAWYANPDGLSRQRMIQKVMDRIVRQEIPAAVVDNPLLDWNPYTNAVSPSKVTDLEAPAGRTGTPTPAREPDTRYRHWLSIYRANRLADPYHPDEPTHVDRRFNVEREIPEKEVQALFDAVLGSPVAARVGEMVSERLGRPLEPFDIWYAGFRPGGSYLEEELDAVTKKRYPTADAYAADMPRMLVDLGFDETKARFLTDHIVVEPSRGAGHAFGAARRDDKAHLRTRVGSDGMDYKGYNIAVHEMGHNVEQVFSMTTIDHTLLEGVPNTAFTEALAFVFQGRDLELLGLQGPDPLAESLNVLDTFWATREIAGVALVDMKVWRWLYDHPDATPEQLREAVVSIAGDVWNTYHAPIFGVKDVPILAIYSHMVDLGMYTPDYPLGHLIAFQVEEHFRKAGKLGPEFERVSRIGLLTPDAWMRQAVGASLSATPLLEATERALAAMK